MSAERAARTVGRAVLGWFFVHSGQGVLRDPGPATELAAPALAMLRKRMPAIPVDDVTVVRLNAAVHVMGGALLAAGRLPRLASLVLAASLVPTTAAGHPFWAVEDPFARRMHRTMFDKNVAVLGGLLVEAGRTS